VLGFTRISLIVAPEAANAPVMPPVIVPIVQEKVLGALDTKVIFGLVPLQVLAVRAFVTAGVGITVTVIVKGAPAHEPVVEVGVTLYCTVPEMLLLGLVSIWLIVGPELALAPVTPPVTVPIVHEKLLAPLAVKVIFGLVPLQTVAVFELVTAGAGLTVTVIVRGVPTHEPTVEVGVTMYSTVPAMVLLGLVSIWLIVDPELAVAPVMPPVIVPVVQV